ncbi:amino acid adenylation domain-containing protein, partial [Kitasatospora aburaviensis]
HRPDGIPIGRPLGDRHLHLLDHHLTPTPLGTIAELHIGGTQLARGYLNRPALTADHFRPDPHTDQPGARLYRTGDLTRWTTDGHLTYHGRTDHQIKIRGYRIETGEIETRLREHPHIHDAAVTTHHDRLIAYLATTPGSTTHGIREWLAERLPEYMVPTLLVPLDELPRTVGGKTDRTRLPDPDDHRPEPAGTHEPPRDATEQAIADVWQEVLQLDRIGIHDNFFDLGGHSLLATLAVARLTKALERPVDVRLFFERPTIAEFAAALPPAPARPEPQIGRMVRSGDFPLSFAQEGLWFLHRLAPEAPDYTAALAWRVAGELDPARLDRALGQLAARHESLRTTFPLVDAQPVQRVDAAPAVTAVRHDLRGLDDPYGEAVRQAAEELHRPFDLAAGPLVRVTLWRTGADEHLLVLALHHIVSDGWSLGVLVRELGALYEGRALPDLPIQYADFADWQRRELAGATLERGLDYWRKRLAALPALELPTDRPRPAEPSWAGATREFTLEPELVTRLEQLGRAHGATLYMTLLAAFQILLGRWSGQRDFGIGVPVAGRGRPEVEHLIGLFINTLVLRADLTGDPTFTDLLTRVRDHTLDALDHQDVPFDRVVEELHPDRGAGRSPLFQAMFDLEVRSIAMPRLGSAELHTAEIPFGVTKFDLMFTFTTDPGAAGGFVQYRTDLFDAVTIDRLIQGCRTLLATVATAPDTPLSTLPLPAEEIQTLRRLGTGELPAPARDTITQFEDQAHRTPDAIALRTGDTTLTYAELNTRANRLAWWLRHHGVTTETPVAVRQTRGPDMITAVLAILKAGGAYIPIDPAWPTERLDHIRTDAGAHLLLDGPLPTTDRDDNPPPHHHDQQLAYIIYTSGSTGRPKGVGIPRTALTAHTTRIRRRFALGPTDRVLQFAALAFDASAEQIFPALTCGATLVLPDHGLITPTHLLTDLNHHHVTVLEVVPGYLTELIAELSAPDSPHAHWDPAWLRLLVLGGDVVRPADLAWWTGRFPDMTVVNTYGPTEATITTTLFEITPDSTHRPDGIPIGRPLGDRHLHLLDHHLTPTPLGTIAELHIGGTQLARGYLNQPALTADHFRPDPHTDQPGARLYRTGDLTRWTTDGHLTYHGRTDHQIKIRGYRIETGEIETRLREHPHIHDAAVTTHHDRLIAYLATTPDTPTHAIREWLRERLPDYMVPSTLIPLDELPRTVGGKTDRTRLPDPDDHRPEPAGTHEPPRNPTEQAIADVWQEVLQLDRIGIHDNFFDLGGHSLLATRVAIRMRTAFGCDIGVRALFDGPTVARLATAVEEQLTREIAAMTGEDVAEALKGKQP